MPRSRDQSIKQLSLVSAAACAPFKSKLFAPGAAHSKLIASFHRIGPPYPTPSFFYLWGKKKVSVSLHFCRAYVKKQKKKYKIPALQYVCIRDARGRGIVGWSSAAFPAACPSSSFRYHHLHPLPFSSSLLPVLQGSKTMSYNSSRRIIPRSWLRDWNPQLPSSSHMALSFFSLWHCLSPQDCASLACRPSQHLSYGTSEGLMSLSLAYTLPFFLAFFPFPLPVFPQMPSFHFITVIVGCNIQKGLGEIAGLV